MRLMRINQRNRKSAEKRLPRKPSSIRKKVAQRPRAFYSKEFREFLVRNKGLLPKLWQIIKEHEGGLKVGEKVTREIRLNNEFHSLVTVKLSHPFTSRYEGRRNRGVFKLEIEGKSFFVKILPSQGDIDQIKVAQDLRKELLARKQELQAKFPGITFEVVKYHYGHSGKEGLPGIIITELHQLGEVQTVQDLLQSKKFEDKSKGTQLERFIAQLRNMLRTQTSLAPWNAFFSKWDNKLIFFDVIHG